MDLVLTANSDLPHSTEWQEGSKIEGAGNPALKPGTTIATFDPDGKYHGECRTGQHAAVFLEYTTEAGKPGMMVLDQWLGQPPHVRFIPFDDGKKRQNNAGSLSSGDMLSGATTRRRAACDPIFSLPPFPL